jgi:hypothetical protein
MIQYLFNNVRPLLRGIKFITFAVIKNILVGAVNSLLQDDFEGQILCLILVEVCYFCVVLSAFLPQRVFHSKIKMSIFLVVSLVKVLLMLSLFVTKASLDTDFVVIE